MRIVLDLFLHDFERENIATASPLRLCGTLRVPSRYVYTSTHMDKFLNNRYIQLAGLTLGLSVLFYVVIWLFCVTVGLRDFPAFLQGMLAVLGAGLVVYKFFSQRIA